MDGTAVPYRQSARLFSATPNVSLSALALVGHEELYCRSRQGVPGRLGSFHDQRLLHPFARQLDGWPWNYRIEDSAGDCFLSW